MQMEDRDEDILETCPPMCISWDGNPRMAPLHPFLQGIEEHVVVSLETYCRHKCCERLHDICEAFNRIIVFNPNKIIISRGAINMLSTVSLSIPPIALIRLAVYCSVLRYAIEHLSLPTCLNGNS
jgi:hypothetical protein